jgi:hypothetical protein
MKAPAAPAVDDGLSAVAAWLDAHQLLESEEVTA